MSPQAQHLPHYLLLCIFLTDKAVCSVQYLSALKILYAFEFQPSHFKWEQQKVLKWTLQVLSLQHAQTGVGDVTFEYHLL